MSLSSKQFRGDAPELVQALIEACQRPMVSQPIVERCLQPAGQEWTGASSSALLEPLEANRRSGKFPARHARSPTAATAAAAGAAQERSASNKRRQVASSPVQIPRVASAGGGSRRLSADHTLAGFACPAVAASPKPESLPMPTGLMSRAGRSRSPSPPKDSFFAVSALAHVYPVAA